MTTLGTGRHRQFEKTIFLDRTHGKQMTALLRKVGFTVKSIFEEFPNGAHERVSDPAWIQMCAENDWVAITGDKHIPIRPLEKQALIESGVRLFILSDSNSLPEEWAAAVIVGSEKIQSVVRKNPGPFYANIGKRSDFHVSDAKFFENEHDEEENDKQENQAGDPEVADSGPR